MPVGILNKRLLGSIWSRLARQAIGTSLIKMRFPFIQIIDDQCEMTATMMRMNWLIAITDEMQFLVDAEQKPCARKVEGGTIYRRKLKHLTVKLDAGIDVT